MDGQFPWGKDDGLDNIMKKLDVEKLLKKKREDEEEKRAQKQKHEKKDTGKK